MHPRVHIVSPDFFQQIDRILGRTGEECAGLHGILTSKCHDSMEPKRDIMARLLDRWVVSHSTCGGNEVSTRSKQVHFGTQPVASRKAEALRAPIPKFSYNSAFSQAAETCLSDFSLHSRHLNCMKEPVCNAYDSSSGKAIEPK